MYYINQQGNYYEGDKADYRDQVVPQRPDSTYVWDGAKWVVDPDVIAELDREALVVTDAGIVRGVEDIINVLISKAIIKNEDIPEQLRDKISERKILREKIK